MRQTYHQDAFDFWGDQLPKMVKMKMTVRPDMPFLGDGKLLTCKKDNVYDVTVNQYGAVTAVLGDAVLGLKPDEFEVVESFTPSFEERQSK